MTIIANYNPSINFYVTPTDISPEHTFYGVGIKIKWEPTTWLMYTPKGTYFPRQLIIEASDTANGTFVTLDTVLFTSGQYIDNLATSNRFYRLTTIDASGVVGTPSLPKNIHSPNTCRIWGRAVGVNGEPIKNVPIYFRVPNLPDSNTSDGYLLVTKPACKETNKDGYFEIDLLSGIVVSVSCSDMSIKDREFIVPSDPSANLFDLL